MTSLSSSARGVPFAVVSGEHGACEECRIRPCEGMIQAKPHFLPNLALLIALHLFLWAIATQVGSPVSQKYSAKKMQTTPTEQNASQFTTKTALDAHSTGEEPR